MRGPIRRVVLHRVEPRDEARLPGCWIGSGSPDPNWTDGTWLTRGAPPVPPAGDGPVLVLLGADAAGARSELVAHAASGARVYVLVGPGWGTDSADAQVFQAARVLVRRVTEVPASAVHVGTVARLWLGSGFVLRLDESQANALRQVFLRLFWHEATEEAWSGGRTSSWRAAAERPFDVPELPSVAPVRWERADARLTGDARGALVHLTGGAPPDVVPRRLWFPAGPEHHERLGRLVQAGAQVLWDHRGLPDLLVGGEAGEALLPGARGRLRVRLVAGQAAEVARLLEADGAWRFHANVRLGDPGHRDAMFWLTGEDAPRRLEAQQVVKVPDVEAASLRVVPETGPASVPAAQPLALSVRYEWTVVPPRAPSGTADDAIVGRWRKLDEDWSSRLARVRDALIASEKDRGRIAGAFSSLVSAILGFERTHTRLERQLAELEHERPSKAGPSGAATLLTRLVEVEEQARKLQADLDDAERKARDEAERKKQHAEWRTRVDEASRALAERREALAQAESRLRAVEGALRSTLEALADASDDGRPDLEARKRKLTDDRSREEKTIKALQADIARLDRDAAEPFEFRPPPVAPRPSAPGGRFVPATSNARSWPPVPDEALPEVGILRTREGQRYLIIESWEDLAVGEHAAARLSARLVAPENT